MNHPPDIVDGLDRRLGRLLQRLLEGQHVRHHHPQLEHEPDEQEGHEHGGDQAQLPVVVEGQARAEEEGGQARDGLPHLGPRHPRDGLGVAREPGAEGARVVLVGVEPAHLLAE